MGYRGFATLLMIALIGSVGCGGDIRSDELSRSIDTLVSSAREGALIAQGVADDGTKTTFVRVRARELTEATDHEAEKLSDASADQALESDKKAAVALSSQISDVLGQLQVSPMDPVSASKVAKHLERLADKSEKLQRDL